MGHMSVVHLALVAFWCQESSAVTSVFVQKGKDVQLNITEADLPTDFFVIRWTINESAVATFSPDKGPSVGNLYTGRIDFPVKTFSVKLKNLQEKDSGLYTARFIGTEKDQNVAEYNVAVQEPVTPVELSVNSVFNSSDSCNVTVSCSTQDSHISSTFTCDTNTCSQEGGERSEATSSGASLSVYLSNDSITCNHSNQVSRTEDVTKIQDFCPRHAGSAQSTNFTVLIVILGVALLIITIATALYIRKKRRQRKVTIENNTLYATPEAIAAVPHQDPTSDDCPSTTTYALVGHHSGPTGSTENSGNPIPESLYAQIEKHPRS